MPRSTTDPPLNSSDAFAALADPVAWAAHEFAAHSPGETFEVPDVRDGDLVIEVVRPRDLLALTTVWRGVSVTPASGDLPASIVADTDGLLIITFPFQHGQEAAKYEAPSYTIDPAHPDQSPTNSLPPGSLKPPDPTPAPLPPVNYRPARASRLSFRLPAGTTVPLSSAGILSVIPDLVPRVHPLATRQRNSRPIEPAHSDALGTIKTPSSAPRPEVTAVEAPFRLVISPDENGRWVHALQPVAPSDARNVELWHTRLSETPTVRAIWARDRDHLDPGVWGTAQVDHPGGPLDGSQPEEPFLSSLNRADRHRLVRQTAETWLDGAEQPLRPHAVDADKVWLSTLGATLDLHGKWDTLPYTTASLYSLLSWDHIARWGRDQFVRVAYPGYLFPLGHRGVLIKITERTIRPTNLSTPDAGPVAALFQRQFIQLIDRVRDYPAATHRDFPWASVQLSPPVTPTLDQPQQPALFWPSIGGVPMPWRIDVVDRSGNPQDFRAPLLWVDAANHNNASITDMWEGKGGGPKGNIIDLGGQTVAFAGNDDGSPAVVPKGGADTRLEVRELRLLGQPQNATSKPRMSSAEVVVPAAQRVGGIPSMRIVYHQAFVDSGLGGANKGAVWAAMLTPPVLSDPALVSRIGGDASTAAIAKVLGFGKSGQPSSGGGGFLEPNQVIEGLSTAQGTVADLARATTGTFDPVKALEHALPRLLGLVPLTAILDLIGNDAPKLVSDALGPIERIVETVGRALDIAKDAEKAAQEQLDRAQDAAADVKAQLLAAKNLATALITKAQALVDLVADLPPALFAVLGDDPNAEADARAAVAAVQDKIRAMATDIRALSDSFHGKIPPLVRNQLLDVARLFDDIAAKGDYATTLIGAVSAVKAFKPDSLELSFRYDWSPRLRNWPDTGDPVLNFGSGPDLRNLTLAISGRAAGTGTASVDINAQLVDFSLNLLPGEPLVEIPFERLAFHTGSSGKTEVDVVLGKIKFVGFLSFVETIKNLIPFDGFSDPPYVDVDQSGLKAGFNLALPNVAIGVFALSNMSLSADVRVPFLGETVSVGFGFCSRERPFTLAVAFLGGGGWFGLRLSPKGLDLLEMGLEAGAMLAVDFGVASGSISAVIGIYLRMESDKGSLTGYFRLRGEVDVLGLISASIELSMSLEYVFEEKKMIGRATITVEVEVLFFSASVSISAERKFAGSNGDPTFAEVMLEPGTDGVVPWDAYLDSFAVEARP